MRTIPFIDLTREPRSECHVPGRILSHDLVLGTDEVGRGAWAGPVVAAVAGWSPDYRPLWLQGLRDSKLLGIQSRLTLAKRIMDDPNVGYAFAWATVDEIDRWDVRRASLLAMYRAVSFFSRVLHLYVDGKDEIPGCSNQTPVVDGDRRIAQVAAASILAKVFRDRWMESLHLLHPAYGWDRNRGYGTAFHRKALYTLGVTSFHRRSFKPVHSLPLLHIKF